VCSYYGDQDFKEVVNSWDYLNCRKVFYTNSSNTIRIATTAGDMAAEIIDIYIPEL